MYVIVLAIHSWLRWAALLLGAAATLHAWRHRADTTEGARKSRWDTFFMLALDLQILFGLVLYFGLSPFTREAMNNMAAALQRPPLRFWAVEHLGAMFGAAIAVRIGRVRAMNAPTPAARHRARLIWFGVAELAMIVATPWPGLANGRPLFRV